MKSLEEMIIISAELNNQNLADPSEKKNHEYLQDKVKKTSEIVKERLSKKKREETFNIGDDLDREPAVNFLSSKLGKLNNIACLAQSLTAYLITTNSRRNNDKLKTLTIQIYDAVNLWISRLFRYLKKWL